MLRLGRPIVATLLAILGVVLAAPPGASAQNTS